MNVQTKKRLILIFIAALFFVPIIISIVLFQQGWRPAGQINHGILVEPPQPLTHLGSLTFTTVDQQAFKLSQLWDKWTLLTVVQDDCLTTCQENLYKMRQVRLALNQNMTRVQRLLLVRNRDQLSTLELLDTEYAGTLVLDGSEAFATLTKVLQNFTTGDPHKIYVIDPMGNLMMFYPSEANPSKMLKDLGRLLRLSNIG